MSRTHEKYRKRSQLHEGAVAFQAGVAGNLESVADTQTVTHDSLIAMWGTRRLTGISWSIYGPPEAAAHTIGAWTGNQRHVNGTLEEGWEALTALLTHSQTAVPAGYLEGMKAFAAAEANPVLVIATCDVRPPR